MNIDNHIRQRYEELKLLRSSLDSMFKDSQRYVRPNSNKFDHTHTYNKEDDSLQVYDDTAVWCNQMFANGLSSNLIPKADRWMYLKVTDITTEDLTDEQVIYLEQVTERILHEFAQPDSQFYSASHEAFLDIGAYGTSPVQISYIDDTVTFKARPLADVFFDTDMHGKVDTVYYRCFKTARQMMQMFPELEGRNDFNKDKSVHNRYELVYTVCPSNEKGAKQGGRYGKERPFTVYYWSPQLKGIISESGISYMPFLIPRWSKLADEVYGRGPAFTCLSQIRVLNKMVKEALTSAEYLNFPTLIAEEDSIMLPLKYGSRQIMFHEPGSEKPSPIMAGNQPQYVMEMIRMYRETINRSFFVDQIIREQKKERQSVLEIQDTRGQMLSQLSPLLNRMEAEYVGPAIEATYELLRRNKQLPELPQSLQGKTLDIVYTSPSAQSQFATKLTNISAFMRDLAPLAQVKPNVLDALNERELFEKYARYRNVSPTIIKSEDDINAVRQQRAQQEQMLNQAKVAPAIGSAMKDVAQAKSVDPEGIGDVLGL